MSYSVRKNYNPFFKTSDDVVLTVKVFPKDTQVSFSSLKPSNNFISEPEREARRAKRSKIVKFSKRSAKKLRHHVRNSEDMWKVFITLTYPGNFPCNGKETKKHLNVFLQWLRRQGIKYVWVLEFQERGAPHYHIIASEFINKEKLSEYWYRIVGSGDERHLKAGTKIEWVKSKGQLYCYLSGYIKKLDQKIPPGDFENVGRFWGDSRGILKCEVYQVVGFYCAVVWHIKLLRKWNKAHLRQWGIKWKWKGKGAMSSLFCKFSSGLYPQGFSLKRLCRNPFCL